MDQIFQYQGVAEPTAAAGTVESPHADAWAVQASEPPRPLRRATYGLGDSEITGAGMFVSETPHPDAWAVQASEPPRPPRHVPYQLGDLGYGEGVFTTESPHADAWAIQASEPPRQVRHVPYQMGDVQLVESAFVPYPDAWGRSYPDYLRPTPRLADREALFGTFYAALGVNPALGFPYEGASEQPRPLRHIPFQLGDFAYGEGVFTTETPHLDGWYATPPPPPRPTPRPTDRDGFYGTFWADLVTIFNPASGASYPPTEIPTRPLKHVPYQLGDSAYGEGVFTRETITADKWWVEDSAPRRATPRRTPDEQWAAPPEVAFVFAAWPEAEIPVRLVRSLRVDYPEVVQAVGPAFALVPQGSQDPPRPRARLASGGETSTPAEFPPPFGFPWVWGDVPPRVARRPLGAEGLTVLVAPFAPSLGFPYPPTEVPTRPLRRVPYQLGDLGYGEGVFTTEAVYPDKWLPDQDGPPRGVRRPTTLEFFLFATPPVVTGIFVTEPPLSLLVAEVPWGSR